MLNAAWLCRDTGVGMTREDLMQSLGTIARSGTAKFAEVGRHNMHCCHAYLCASKVCLRASWYSRCALQAVICGRM